MVNRWEAVKHKARGVPGLFMAWPWSREPGGLNAAPVELAHMRPSLRARRRLDQPEVGDGILMDGFFEFPRWGGNPDRPRG